jgi:hypothetical protein
VFVRFRLYGRSLQASVVETRRVAGRVRSELIGALGSTDANLSTRSRIAFWAKLPQRLDALQNRVPPDAHPKIYAAVHSRIPMVTPDEQQVVQEEYFGDEARVAGLMRDMVEEQIAGQKSIIGAAENAIATAAPIVAALASDADAARDQLDRLKRGEAVSGGLGDRPDLHASMTAAGWTPRELKRFKRLGSLTKDEFERLKKWLPATQELVDDAIDREVRRIIRERWLTDCLAEHPWPQLGRVTGAFLLSVKVSMAAVLGVVGHPLPGPTAVIMVI